jgi:hypothetical protein
MSDGDFDDMFNRALALDKRGEWSEAVEIYESIAKEAPGTQVATYALNCAERLRGFQALAAEVEPPPQGVGGWLLLLCLSLTVFGPLWTLYNLTESFNLLQDFDRFPGLFVVATVDAILSVGLGTFSIYAGVALWSIRPGAVQTAKTFLLCLLGYVAVAAILPFMAGLPSTASEALIAAVVKNTVRGVVFVAIWYSYLNKSGRVSATYPSRPDAKHGENLKERVMMPQLVNTNCVICGQRISSILDARVCPECMSPVHNACLEHVAGQRQLGESACSTCGTNRDDPQAASVRDKLVRERGTSRPPPDET